MKPNFKKYQDLSKTEKPTLAQKRLLKELGFKLPTYYSKYEAAFTITTLLAQKAAKEKLNAAKSDQR